MEKEILEEAAKRTYQKGLQDDIDLSFYDGVRFGAKWQAKRMYSEEEVRTAIFTSFLLGVDRNFYSKEIEDKIIQQLKKK
jgi:hypothetical protein